MHVVSPVRGMQQATEQAQRPFNNVLGLVRGKCFASSPSLSLSFSLIALFLLLSILLVFSMPLSLCSSTVVTNSNAVLFHFLTNHSWIICVGIMQPGIIRATFVLPLLQQQGAGCGAQTGAQSYRREDEGQGRGGLAGPFWFGQSIFLIWQCFLSQPCSPQDPAECRWAAPKEACHLAAPVSS